MTMTIDINDKTSIKIFYSFNYSESQKLPLKEECVMVEAKREATNKEAESAKPPKKELKDKYM